MATAVAASLVDQDAATIAESYAEFAAVAATAATALPVPADAGMSDLESQDSEDWEAQFADSSSDDDGGVSSDVLYSENHRGGSDGASATGYQAQVTTARV